MQFEETEDLWCRVDIALCQASSREQTISEVNRLLAKWINGLPPNYLNETNCAIRREWLPTEELLKFTRGHSRNNPRKTDGPLLVAEYRGTSYMLDGTNRINRWLQDGNAEKHEVIILTKHGE